MTNDKNILAVLSFSLARQPIEGYAAKLGGQEIESRTPGGYVLLERIGAMIERTCEIVEIPGGGFAALMPLPDVFDNHWVAVKEAGSVMHSNGRVHLMASSYRIASQPWDEGWKPLGMRDVLVSEPNADYDLGGGD